MNKRHLAALVALGLMALVAHWALGFEWRLFWRYEWPYIWRDFWHEYRHWLAFLVIVAWGFWCRRTKRFTDNSARAAAAMVLAAPLGVIWAGIARGEPSHFAGAAGAFLGVVVAGAIAEVPWNRRERRRR
jgi:hypothetical protein